ncbi:metal ABC transporter permease [Arenibaculum pallidiluteum]|uniref:metal ABC transporter permease n=1 Tax=Arenibaculum pallidiluteum TaxID=2812559 RepID=UPI001A976B29|nr:metal ABC transporter permease [Arenibaculum pallidiluteum]
MTDLYGWLIGPFADFTFMRRALVAVLALALGCGPVGVLLILRRMALMGDALAHAVLPGAAVGYLLAGLSLPVMGLGGLAAGLAVAGLAGVVSRITPLREDASFAAFYLISLALGVLIVSTRGGNVDLMHVLFGTVLAVDDHALAVVAGIATTTLLGLAWIYRPLVVECFDPGFLRAVGGHGGRYHLTFLVLVVLNLVGGFQALGTLMAVGLMMLPAAAARFWADGVWPASVVASGMALAAGYCGLLVSFHFDLPSGPSIVLAAGTLYCASVLLGTRGSFRAALLPARHLES